MPLPLATWLLANSAAQSTAPGAITNSQTTLVLASTATFPVPAAGQQYYIRIDTTPISNVYEYALVTGNNTSTNTLTLTRGQAGTSAQGFAAGATVTYALLAETLVGAFAQTYLTAQKFDEQSPNAGTSINLAAVPSWARTVEVLWRARSGLNAQTDTLACQFNSDTGTTYDSARGTLGSTYASGGALLGQTSIVFADIPGATSSAPSWATGTLRILYPNVTLNERGVEGWTTRHDGGVSIAPQMSSGNWRNTSAAISTITILVGTGPFNQCTFAAYAYP